MLAKNFGVPEDELEPLPHGERYIFEAPVPATPAPAAAPAGPDGRPRRSPTPCSPSDP